MPRYAGFSKIGIHRVRAGNANEMMQGKGKRGKTQKGASAERRTELSAACKKGVHSSCFALNCKCDCGHG